MITIITILKILGLSFVISKFYPLQYLIEAVEPLFKKKPIYQLLYNMFSILTSCFNCLCLWVGIIIGGFWIAILSYVISYLYTNSIVSRWEYQPKEYKI